MFVPLQRVITLLYMNRIESILKEKGIKKIRFAEMMDINKQNVNQLFRNPTINTLEKIAKVLDVPVWQLLVSPDEVSDAPVTSSPGGGIVWGERFYPCSTIEELRAAVEQLNGSDKGYK